MEVSLRNCLTDQPFLPSTGRGGWSASPRGLSTPPLSPGARAGAAELALQLRQQKASATLPKTSGPKAVAEAVSSCPLPHDSAVPATPNPPSREAGEGRALTQEAGWVVKMPSHTTLWPPWQGTIRQRQQSQNKPCPLAQSLHFVVLQDGVLFVKQHYFSHR